MANENTLGAPTEGLGQTVTFTANSVGGTPQMRAAQRGQLRTQTQQGRFVGGAQQEALPDLRQADAVLSTLQRLGGDILAPQIKAAKEAAYIDGATRVAQGTAITEIVEEQPWYAKLFGDTPAIEGAKAYASYTKAQQVASELEAAMPTLREVSPLKVQEMLGKRLAAATTGDPDTDALMRKTLMQEFPGFIKLHAKEHLGWQQANLANNIRNAQLTAANRLASSQANYNPLEQADALLNGNDPGAFAGAEESFGAKLNFVQAFERPAGIPEETFSKVTSGVITNMLAQKNLHAYYTLEDAGKIDMLGPETAAKLRMAADRAEGRVKQEMPPEFIAELAAIKTLPSVFDRQGVNEELTKRVANLNAAYKAATGAREPLIAGATAAEMASNLMEKQIANARRLDELTTRASSTRNPAEKQQADADAVTLVVGDMLEGKSVRRASTAYRDEAWRSLRPTSTDPKQREKQVQRLALARYVQATHGTYDELGRDEMRTTARLAFDTDNPKALDDLYLSEFLPLVQAANGNIAVAKTYFGDEDRLGDRMVQYHQLRAGKQSGDVASLSAAFLMAKMPRRADLSKTKGSLDQLALRRVGSIYGQEGGLFGIGEDYPVRPELHQDLAKELIATAERSGQFGTDESRIEAALLASKANGLEIAGGEYWHTGGQPSFLDALSKAGKEEDLVSPSEFNEVVALSVRNLVKRADITGHRVVYWNAPSGPQLAVVGKLKNTENWVAYPLTAQDMIAERRAAKEAAKELQYPSMYTGFTSGVSEKPVIVPAVSNAVKAVTSVKGGPALTFLPKEGAPSIYDR